MVLYRFLGKEGIKTEEVCYGISGQVGYGWASSGN